MSHYDTHTGAGAGLLHLGDALVRSSRPLAAALSYSAGASVTSLSLSLQAWAYYRAGSLYVHAGRDDENRWEGIRLLKKSMVLLKGILGSHGGFASAGGSMDPGSMLMGVFMVLEEGYGMLGEERAKDRTIKLAGRNTAMVMKDELEDRWKWWVYWRAKAVRNDAQALWECVADCEKRGKWTEAVGFALMACKDMVGCDGDGVKTWNALQRVDHLWKNMEGTSLNSQAYVLKGCFLCLKSIYFIRRGRYEESYNLLRTVKKVYEGMGSQDSKTCNPGIWKWLSARAVRSLILHIISVTLRSAKKGTPQRAEKYAHEALRAGGVDPSNSESLSSAIPFADADMTPRQKIPLLVALLESLARLQLATLDLQCAHITISAANARLKDLHDDVLPGIRAAHELLCGEYYALLGKREAAVTADKFFTSALSLTSLIPASDVAETAKTQKSLLTGVQRLPNRDEQSLEASIVNPECARAAWFAEAVYAARSSHVSDASAALLRTIEPAIGEQGQRCSDQIAANALVMLSNITLAQEEGRAGSCEKAEKLAEEGWSMASKNHDPVTKARATRQKMKVISRKRRRRDSDMESEYKGVKRRAMEEVMAVMKKLGNSPATFEFHPAHETEETR